MSLEELFNDCSEFFDEAQCKVTIIKGGCIEWHSGEDLGDDEQDDEQDDDSLLRCDNLESYEGIKPGSYNNGI